MEKDAEAIIRLYKEYGICIFKIDGLSIPTKEAEMNLHRLFDYVLAETDNQVVLIWMRRPVAVGDTIHLIGMEIYSWKIGIQIGRIIILIGLYVTCGSFPNMYLLKSYKLNF